MSDVTVRTLPRLPVPLPYKRILGRLGHNRHHTVLYPHHLGKVETAIRMGFALCRPAGTWATVPVMENTGEAVRLGTGDILPSRSLARLLAGSHEVALMAATVGPGIVEATQNAVEEKNAFQAAILDAVGGQTADAALGWIHDYLGRYLPRSGGRITRQRFSPGYGDLGLEVQKTVFDLLDLGRLGLRLTDRYMLLPEKSVLGIAGVRPLATVPPE